jgi:hypothetical protein
MAIKRLLLNKEHTRQTLAYRALVHVCKGKGKVHPITGYEGPEIVEV